MDVQSWKTYVSDLDTKALVGIGLGISFLYWFITVTIQWYRLRHVPGPPFNAITSLYSCWWMKSSDFSTFVMGLREKHGSIVRLTPTGVMIDDPDEGWRINSARSAYHRSGWYSSMKFNPWGGTILTEMSPVSHDKRKAKLIHGFSGRSIQNVERRLDKQIAVLKDVLKARIAEGAIDSQKRTAVLDVSRILHFFQVDLITYTGLGEAWGNLPQDKDHFNYLQDSNAAVSLAHAAAMVPFLRRILFSDAFLRVFGPSRTGGWLGALHKAVERQVSGHSEAKVEDGNILDMWLRQGLSPADAEADLSLLLPAGTDTSIAVIRATLLYLMVSPTIYAALKQEIADGIKQGCISSPVTTEEARNLPYLHAVINEGLRIAPPTTAGFPKAVPPGGDVVCGKYLPAGTDVYMCNVGMMRRKDVFGDDVDVFRPERFLDCDDATKTRRLKTVDLNFGFGRWLCLGKVFAWMEMYKVFVELLRSFDFQVANPEKPWQRTSTISWIINDLNAVVTYNPMD